MKSFKSLAPIIFLTVLLLVYFTPTFVGWTFIGSGMFYSDLMGLNYPFKDWYRELLLDSQLPFWTSLVGNGYPIFAEGQIGALYPPHLILFRFLPTLLAFNLNLFLHFLAAAIFTFLFCRICLKLSPMASLLAGLAYSFSGFFLTHLHQVNILLVVSYLPLIFLLIERLIKTQKYLWVFLLSLTIGFQGLAGHLEMVYYTSLASFLFFILMVLMTPPESFSGKRRILSKLFLFILAFALGLGIPMVQILSTRELTEVSWRATGISFESATEYDWPPKALSLFLNPYSLNIFLPTPDFHPMKDAVNYNFIYGYLGLIPILLAFLAMVSRFRNRFVLIFTILLFGALIFGMGRSTQLFSIFWTLLPGLKLFRQPVKILFLIEFSLAVLAAFGFDWLMSILAKKRPRWQKILPTIGILLILLTFIDLYFNNALRIQPVISAREWFNVPPAAEFLKKNLDDSHPRFYTETARSLDVSTFRDFKLQKDLQNTLEPGFNVLYRLPSSQQEWLPLYLQSNRQFNENAVFWDGGTGILKLQNKKAFDLQNVKFVISNLPVETEGLVLRKEIPLTHPIQHFGFFSTPNGLKTAAVPTEKTYIYENQDVYPRILLVGRARVIEDKNKILETIFSRDFNPTQEVILNEPAKLEAFQEDSGQAKTELLIDRESEIEIRTEADQARMLVLADTYYPGWQATVDGAPTKIYRANFAFRAVEVPAGQHLVKFTFEPTYWRLGLLISGGTLMVVFLGLGYCLWKRR